MLKILLVLLGVLIILGATAISFVALVQNPWENKPLKQVVAPPPSPAPAQAQANPAPAVLPPAVAEPTPSLALFQLEAYANTENETGKGSVRFEGYSKECPEEGQIVTFNYLQDKYSMPKMDYSADIRAKSLVCIPVLEEIPVVEGCSDSRMHMAVNYLTHEEGGKGAGCAIQIALGSRQYILASGAISRSVPCQDNCGESVASVQDSAGAYNLVVPVNAMFTEFTLTPKYSGGRRASFTVPVTH